MSDFINHNGKLIKASDPVISVLNHNYRYGDGVFETMKMINGKIPLFTYHSERLHRSMKVLDFNIPLFFSTALIENEIIKLAEKNNCLALARIRLSVSRGNGGVNDCDDNLDYTIECVTAGDHINYLNENGFIVDIFPDAIKSCDKYSNLKSSSYLHYIMAAKYARENKLNDALLLNQRGRICEAAIANIFWVKNEIVYTPFLSEGCVAGVIRKYLLEKMPEKNIPVKEKQLTIEELENADEVFLTNAIYGIRWVRQFRNKSYQNNFSNKIYQSILSPLYR